MPIPRPGPLVVKNGVKIRVASSGRTPGPLSLTEMTTFSPSRLPRTLTSPPLSGHASIAFCTRFERTWLNSSGTHSIVPSPGRSRSTCTGRPVAGSTIATTSRTAPKTSYGRSWREYPALL
ncbi:MAG: hypothetical protein E6J58_20160 [Deltaproteobacteria bacterium]|nr:MAG: hypothetical protein E6J58_20160 [Deltaproteobacteria bacterium]